MKNDHFIEAMNNILEQNKEAGNQLRELFSLVDQALSRSLKQRTQRDAVTAFIFCAAAHCKGAEAALREARRLLEEEADRSMGKRKSQRPEVQKP